MLNQIRELCLLPGVSSFEAPVRSFLRARAELYADDIRTDAMGNLIVFKKGRKATGQQAASWLRNMDEVGLSTRSL